MPAQFFDMLLTVGEDKNSPPASDKLVADPENELVAFGVTGKPVHQFGVNEPCTEGFGMLKAADVEPDGQVVRLLEFLMIGPQRNDVAFCVPSVRSKVAVSPTRYRLAHCPSTLA